MNILTLARTFLTISALALAASAQTVELRLDGGPAVSFEGDGWATCPAGGDYWRFGDEAGLANGDLDQPIEEVSGHLTITVDGEVVHDADVSVPFATSTYSRLAPLTYAPLPGTAGLIDELLSGGPSSDDIPASALSGYTAPWPLPLPEDKDQTGSGMLQTPRVPLWQRAMLRGSLTPAETAALEQGIREWAECGMLVYRSSAGHQPYRADEHLYGAEKHILYQGYRRAGGGFSTLFSAVLPPGVEWPESGRAIGGAQHLADDQMWLAHALTGSWMARRIGMAHVEATRSYADDEFWPAARSFGRYASSLCWSIMLGDDRPRMLQHLSDLLTRLESRNRYYSGTWAPVLDSGKQGEAGHLDLNELGSKLTAAGVPPQDQSYYAESGSSWMTAQLFLSMRRLYRHAGLSKALRVRVRKQMDLSAAFLLACCSPAIDVHAAGYPFGLPPSGCWDELAPAARLAEGGSEQWARGLGIRFVAPALAEAAQQYPAYADHFLKPLDTIKTICDESQWWNTKDFDRAMLEWLWPVGSIHGWWN